MANPQFILGLNTLVLSKAPAYPVRSPRERIQAVDRTAAGGLQVESLGAGINRRVMNLINLPFSDFEALQNWFDNIANGAVNAFTLIDEDSNSFIVHWVNTFDFEETKAGYHGTIEFEIID